MSIERWEQEEVPSSDILYVRVHEDKINKKGPDIGLPKANAFHNTPKDGPDLSSDWNKYSDPMKSREQIGKEYRHNTVQFKNPANFFIVSLLIKDILDLNLKQTIEHTPRQENFPLESDGSPWNRAHCSIIGSDEERRLKMVDIAKWEISPLEYNSSKDTREFRH